MEKMLRSELIKKLKKCNPIDIATYFKPFITDIEIASIQDDDFKSMLQDKVKIMNDHNTFTVLCEIDNLPCLVTMTGSVKETPTDHERINYIQFPYYDKIDGVNTLIYRIYDTRNILDLASIDDIDPPRVVGYANRVRPI